MFSYCPHLVLSPRMLAMTSLTPRASVLRLGSTLGLSITCNNRFFAQCCVHVYSAHHTLHIADALPEGQLEPLGAV